MDHFLTQNQHIWSFLKVYSSGFSEIALYNRHQKLGKSDWVVPQWDIFGPKNSKFQKVHKIFSLDFSKFLCDGGGIEKEVKVFDYVKRTPLWTFSGAIWHVS